MSYNGLAGGFLVGCLSDDEHAALRAAGHDQPEPPPLPEFRVPSLHIHAPGREEQHQALVRRMRPPPTCWRRMDQDVLSVVATFLPLQDCLLTLMRVWRCPTLRERWKRRWFLVRSVTEFARRAIARPGWQSLECVKSILSPRDYRHLLWWYSVQHDRRWGRELRDEMWEMDGDLLHLTLPRRFGMTMFQPPDFMVTENAGTRMHYGHFIFYTRSGFDLPPMRRYKPSKHDLLRMERRDRDAYTRKRKPPRPYGLLMRCIHTHTLP